MVLGFRRRSSTGKTRKDGASNMRSPSLPEMTTQGIPWPPNLVDISSIRQENANGASPQQGQPPSNDQGGGPISSLYMSVPPSAFDNWRSSGYILPRTRLSQRRHRTPPTFNVMVVGAQGTGKTSLLRLLLETAEISPTATADQRAALDRFLRGNPKRTQTIQTACIEICESRDGRVLLSVVDTPGLDFREGRELKLDRQVTGIVRYVDSLYSDTMNEESKVVRQGKGDHHIHLCIYMIDPASIMPASARRAQSSLPTRTRSEATITYQPQDLGTMTDPSLDSDDEDDEESKLTMSPADLRIIRRLSKRMNVLPVIACSDTLTDEKLTAAKKAIKEDLHEAGLDFGIFEPAQPGGSDKTDAVPPAKSGEKEPLPKDGSVSGTPVTPSSKGNGHTVLFTPSTSGGGAEENDVEEEEERQPRPIIKLRPVRLPKPLTRSRSRTRRGLSEETGEDSDEVPDLTDKESVANARFSAHVVARVDIGELLPFGVITPEHAPRRHRPLSSNGHHHDHLVPVSPSEDGHARSTTESLASPASTRSMRSSVSMPFLQGPPEDLKGVFTRKFRWGTIDVLNPDHCDIAALRTAIMSTNMKKLKTHTKEVLYEKYRMEKLLARRATRNISEAETKQLLEDLGI